MIAAVVPVGTLAGAKSRLRPELGAEALERLVLRMLEDVLNALLEVDALTRVAAVTPDEAVARCARAAGAEALLYMEPGLNPAIEWAGRQVAPDAEDGLLVVLGDVPSARAEELSELIASVQPPGAALAPANDGGTAALYRAPRAVIPAAFGRQSAAAHHAHAERAGVALRELPLPSLSLDLDEPSDVEKFLAGPSGGERTRTFLRELGAGAKT